MRLFPARRGIEFGEGRRHGVSGKTVDLTAGKLFPSILVRYVMRECAVFFTVSLIAFTGILLTVRLLKFSSAIINKGVDVRQIALVFASIVPTFLEFAVPLSVLLGVMLAVARLSGDSEMVVFRASGISLYQLLVPVALFGLAVTGASVVVSNRLKPWGYSTLSDTLFEIARTRSTAGLESGVFNRLGPLTLYADRVDDRTGGLTRVVVDDKRDEVSRRVIVARTGSVASDPALRTITFNLFDGEIHENVKDAYLTTRFRSNVLSTGLDDLFDADAAQKGRAAREMTGDELDRSETDLSALVASLRSGEAAPAVETLTPLLRSQFANQTIDLGTARRKLRRVEVEKAVRLSLPAASLVLAVLALPLGVQPARTQRTWGAGLSVMVGMAVFLVYFGLLSVGMSLSEGGALPPIVTVWVPDFAAAATAWFLVRKIGREEWSSVAEGASRLRSLLPGRAGTTP